MPSVHNEVAALARNGVGAVKKNAVIDSSCACCSLFAMIMVDESVNVRGKVNRRRAFIHINTEELDIVRSKRW